MDVSKLIFSHQKLKFNYNPFGGLRQEEIKDTIIPHFDLEEVRTMITSKELLLIQFLGKKGRGKTTHLIHLHQFFPSAPLLLLDRNPDLSILDDLPNDLLFIDSIHHIPLIRRIKLFKKTNTIIFSTHVSRSLEARIAAKKIMMIHFKGITPERLTKILRQRIQKSLKVSNSLFDIDQEIVQQLIKRFGDDYRGILNYLFDEFQT